MCALFPFRSSSTAPQSYFPSRAVRLGLVVPFSGGEVAPSSSGQLRGLLIHAVDCAIVPLRHGHLASWVLLVGR